MTRLADLRAEMIDLLEVQLEKGRQYKRRRAIVEAQHANEPFEVRRRHLNQDVILTELSNGSKTAATLITSLALAILAELEYRREFD